MWDESKKQDTVMFEKMLPAGQEWFTTVELAELTGRSPQHIRDWLEMRLLPAHGVSTQQDAGACGVADLTLRAGGAAARRRRPSKSGQRRRSYRIHRSGVVLYLLETANYRSEDFAERLVELLDYRSLPELEYILKRTQALVTARRAATWQQQ